MRRVPKTFYGVPKLARRSILWPKHVQNDETTAWVQQGPNRAENHAGLYEMVEREADHGGVKRGGREWKFLGERPNESDGALGFDFTSKLQILPGQVDPDYCICAGGERWQ